MKNPFIISGEAYGEGFIGRKKLLKSLINYLFVNDSDKGSISLTGIPRTGKSSLMLNIRNSLIPTDRKIYTVEMSTGKCKDFESFWITLLWAIYDELADKKILSYEEMTTLKPYLDEEKMPPIKFRRGIEKFFRDISKKCKLVLFIDEFDYSEKVFGNDSSSFQFLRDLISEADYSISFVVASRRSIKHIEALLHYLHLLLQRNVGYLYDMRIYNIVQCTTAVNLATVTNPTYETG
jgi:AAA+ ATPase superfamily predicted ATPase